jgi:protein involved in polysaccharide export with SLBB domain
VGIFMLSRSLFCFGLAALTLAAPVRAQSDSAPVAAPAADLSDYRLGTGDRVRIITFGEPSLTGEFQVSGVGTISLPLIGDIKAAGATTNELQSGITSALKNGFLNNPSISVEVLQYRPFYILGEVNKPGEYPYSIGATVMNAVATASGFTYRASKHKVMIKHANEREEKPYTLDPNTPVLPGDTIRVPERHF